MSPTRFTRRMASTTLLTEGQKYYGSLRAAKQQGNLPEVDRLLCEIGTVYTSKSRVETNGTTDEKFTTDPDEVKFWLIDVARLMLEAKSASTRRLALIALEAAVPLLVRTNYQEQAVWTELRTTISRDYTSLLDTARSEKDPHWHRMWAVLVRVMNRDLCQGSSIINMFLSIVEAGFRSPELSIREQSFDCWRLLVEVFSKNKQMNLPKRIKLICIPLKSSKSKTETIALKKFDIWWYLLNELRSHLDGLADTIFEPFIYFCFGPSFKPPLCYYFDDSFQEYGAPGKIYQAIKQLSAIALIHLLGPAPEVTKSLLNYGEMGGRTLPFDFPKTGMIISPVLFSTKIKLLIDACIECTVLFAQMKHLNYLELNRCLWGNLMERISSEKTVPKNELLQRIKEVMNALLRLCIKQENDVSLRELLYDTLLIIAKSDVLTVNIGYDSPEQPMLNYKSFMSAILHPDFPCPGDISEEIVKHVFDLQRYSKQRGYWEMLQKTVQYLCETDGDQGTSEFRMIRTQIFCHLASYLIVQIRDDPDGFAEHQSTVMSFLLYPLEYDQLVFVESVRSLWDEVYKPIALQEKKSCEFTNTFCEMIKAMTIAKFAFNLGVVADFFCTILRSLSPEFDSSKPPMKVFELFKDLTRKAQAYQANLNRVEKMVRCFRELLEKLSITNMLTLILPVRNAINEMISNGNGLAMEEVKRTLNVVAGKMVSSSMVSEIIRQPKEVQWNCKMLLSMMLELPTDVRKGWKQANLIKCMDVCDGKQVKTPTRKKVDDEFVVIDYNWKFKPECLTDHQREKMMEKRTDIPALYNDMSQSQDSFVIKPWTPNNKQESVRNERLSTGVVSSSDDSISTVSRTESASQKSAEIVVPAETQAVTIESTFEEDESKAKLKRPDKENNDGNVLREQEPEVKAKEEVAGLEDDVADHTSAPRQKRGKKTKRSILEQLRIDTVEGKTLEVMNLSRTRRSEVPEKRPTRRKSVPVRKVESEKKPQVDMATKLNEKSVSVAKVTAKRGLPSDARSSRKLLNFENIGNTSDDVIESSQTPLESQSLVGRKGSLRGSRVEESSVVATEGTVAIEKNKKMEVDNTNAPPPSATKEVSKSVEVQKERGNDVSEEYSSRNDMDVDQPSAVDQDKPGDKAQDDQIVPKKSGIESSKIDVNPAEDRKIETPQKKETRIDSAIVRGLSEDVRERPVILHSPSRRSTRLTSTDDDAAKVNDPQAGRCLGDCKTPQGATLPQSSNHSPISDVRQYKGTPTKLKLSSSDIPVRVALQLLNSPKRNLVEEIDQGLVENRTGLGSPKVARYSPLVVLEPIKDYSAVMKGVSTASSVEKDETTSFAPEANSTEPVNSGQTTGTAEPLSPMRNLDEEMEPLNKSLNCSIVSSPDLVNAEERNADLMNSTVNISPISEEKSEYTNAPPDSSVLAGSADRRASNRGMLREHDSILTNTPVQMPPTSRRAKQSLSLPMASPVPVSSSVGMKPQRTQPNQTPLGSPASIMGTPRSPSANMINLGGRGAQLINLIRQSPNPHTPPQNASTPKGGQSVASANRLMMRKKAITASAASATQDSNAPAPSATKRGDENRERDSTQYLVFSKVLPSPQASPASSILKRRHNVDDSGDDIESPVNKRKRVSFHDPPVSVTKEYIRQVEECRSPSISRCLQLATSMSSADKAKYMMRRRSKSDSISELQNFTKNNDGLQSEEPSAAANTEAPRTVGDVSVVDGDDEELTSSPESLDENQFMVHDVTGNMAALQVTAELMDVEKSACEHESAPVEGGNSGVKFTKSGSPQKPSDHGAFSSDGVRFSSEEAVLQHVLQRYALDDIVERYVAAGRMLEYGKTLRMLTKELSSVMSKDPKIRHLVLDELSERHSVEFLEHAIQENSSAMVCERLSLTAMTDHIFKHLRSECVGGSAASSSSASSPTTMLHETDNDSLRLVQRIYENLLNLPDIESNGQTLAMLRDRILREELRRKSRLEVMGLLEEYFKTSDRA